MTVQTVDSEKVRVPRVEPGEVVMVTRYHEPSVVLLHPDDYERMERAQRLVERIGRLEPRKRSALEAAVIRDSQDEEFDPSVIAEEDLVG